MRFFSAASLGLEGLGRGGRGRCGERSWKGPCLGGNVVAGVGLVEALERWLPGLKLGGNCSKAKKFLQWSGCFDIGDECSSSVADVVGGRLIFEWLGEDISLFINFYEFRFSCALMMQISSLRERFMP